MAIEKKYLNPSFYKVFLTVNSFERGHSRSIKVKTFSLENLSLFLQAFTENWSVF